MTVRTEQEIIEKIQELRQAWKELNASHISDDVLATVRQDISGQLVALYWCLGCGRQNAVDKAEIALGGEPLDWS